MNINFQNFEQASQDLKCMCQNACLKGPCFREIQREENILNLSKI